LPVKGSSTSFLVDGQATFRGRGRGAPKRGGRSLMRASQLVRRISIPPWVGGWGRRPDILPLPESSTFGNERGRERSLLSPLLSSSLSTEFQFHLNHSLGPSSLPSFAIDYSSASSLRGRWCTHVRLRLVGVGLSLPRTHFPESVRAKKKKKKHSLGSRSLSGARAGAYNPDLGAIAHERRSARKGAKCADVCL